MPEQTQTIGDRISFDRSANELTVVITQQISRKKETIFLLWLLALLLAGGAFINYWISNPAGSSDRVFFMVCTAFIAFFLVRYGKVFLWRKIGREMIRIKGEEMSIKNAFGSYGRAQFFNTNNVHRFGVIPYDFTKFGQFMDRAFWEMGGETLGFEHGGRKYRFGKQLDEREAERLARVIDKCLRDIPKLHRKKLKANLKKEEAGDQ